MNPIPTVDPGEWSDFWLSAEVATFSPDTMPRGVWLAVVHDATQSYGYERVYAYETCEACRAAEDAWYESDRQSMDMMTCSAHDVDTYERIPVVDFSPEGVAYAGHYYSHRTDDEAVVVAYRYSHKGWGAIVGCEPDDDAPFGWRVACWAN